MSEGESSETAGARSGRTLMLVGALAVVLLGVLTLALYVRGVQSFLFFSDDAFISYRYSRHVVEGHGLAWNPGEFVEGYTSFLWIWVGVAAIELGLPPEWVSVGITMVAGGLILILLSVFSARLHRWSNPLVLLAPLLLANNRTFLAWSSGGLATQLFSFLVLLSVVVFLYERKRGVTPTASALLFALTTLTRPEGVLFMTAAGTLFLWDVATRKRSLRTLLAWALPYVAIVGGHVLWRHSYYDYWLPNTYYAKVSGRVRIDEGLFYMRVFLAEYGLSWFLPLLLVPVTLRRRAEDFLFLGFILIFTAYVVWVGGDWMEFRFLNVILPYTYWLMVEGVGLLFALVGRHEPIARLLRARAGLHQVVPSVWVLVLSYMLKALAGVWMLQLVVVTYRATARTDAEAFRRGGAISDVRRQMLSYAGTRRAQGESLRGWVERGLLPEDLRIAVGGSGALPYYSRLYTIDILGWNDVVVAHGPITNPGRIGHEREASPAYLKEKRAEVIDATNGLVRTGDPATFPRSATKSFYTGDLLCYEIEEGWYLLCGTTLTPEELDERLSALRRVF